MRPFLTGAAVVTAAALTTGGVLFATHSGPSDQVGTRLAASQATAANSYPAHYAAPYLQITGGDAGDMAADMSATGLKYYTLAFLIPQSGCTPEWEDGGDSVGAFTAQINSLKTAGGNVIISFGGESGGELAETCTSVNSLTAAYANVVNTYGVNRLDFDIEGDTLSNTAASTRRGQALAALQAQDPAVQVDYTLAVGPERPALAGTGCAQGRQGPGGQGQPGQHHDHGLRQRAERPERRAVRGPGHLGPAGQPVRHLHRAGLRDDGAGRRLRQAAGYAYSKIFNAITGGTSGSGSGGGTGGGGGTSTTGAITGYGDLCLDDTGWSTTPGTQAQIWSCAGTANQAWKLP